MIKRLIDLVASTAGLLIASPLLLPVIFFVWIEDKQSPFYIAARVGLNGKPFEMVKLRSMVINADRLGAHSTSNSDRRITPVGHFIRRYKLDELTQLWNVFTGDMSLVGPRPQVEAGVAVYTARERTLLNIRPGITDFASIVFSDEGSILAGQADPDIAYDQLIRPGKSLLGLFYIQNRSLWIDINLIWLTLVGIVSRPRALVGVTALLRDLGADEALLELAARSKPLLPRTPPE